MTEEWRFTRPPAPFITVQSLLILVMVITLNYGQQWQFLSIILLIVITVLMIIAMSSTVDMYIDSDYLKRNPAQIGFLLCSKDAGTAFHAPTRKPSPAHQEAMQYCPTPAEEGTT